MIRILILGGSGMIGHQLLKSYESKYSVMVTLRNNENYYKKFHLFNKKNSIYELDILNFESLESIIKLHMPQFIINAIGITKQKINKIDKDKCIAINTHFPHKLSNFCKRMSIKLIHLSTDCVFSGIKGNYNEDDIVDCNDLYGLTKSNGEIINLNNVITLRKSTIGFELEKKHGLLEWFLSSKGEVHGYKNAIFSGVTTLELSKIIENIFLKNSDMYGLWHVSGNPINKYDLLNEINKKFKIDDIKINIDHNIVYDRTLNGKKFFNHAKYKIPSWSEMLDDLYKNSLINKN